MRYLASSSLRKEDLAHEIAKTHRYIANPQGRETITAMLAARGKHAKTLENSRLNEKLAHAAQN